MLDQDKLLLTAILLSFALPMAANGKEQQSNPKKSSAANQSNLKQPRQSSTVPPNHPEEKSTSASREQKGAAQEGIQLGQWNKLYGPTTVSSTKNALCIYTTLNHIVIVAQAPDWDVVEFNTENKKYCKMPFDRAKPIMQRTIAIFSGDMLSLAPVQPIKTGTVFGINATQMRTPRSYYKAQIMRNRQKLCEHSSPRTVELTVTKEDTVNPKAASVALRMMNLPMPPPSSIGLPLECTFADIGGDMHRMLQTLSAKKKLIPPSTFAMPKGYKKVDELGELLSDPARDEDMTDFLQEPVHKH